jgi:drug/metabolite transporter (DMT)-like permease
MDKLVNQYSAVVSAALLTLVLGFFLLKDGLRWTNLLALAAILAGLFLVWLAAHPTQTQQYHQAAQVQSQIGAGKPVLLEFQSPY